MNNRSGTENPQKSLRREISLLLLGVTFLIFSLSGATLAQTGEQGFVITANNASNLVEFHRWQAYDAEVTELAFLPDSTNLISSGNQLISSEAIRLWSIQDGQVSSEENPFEGLSGTGYIRFSPDGQRMLAVTGGVAIWDTSNGALVGRAMQWGAGTATFAADNTSVIGGSSTFYDSGVLGVWSIPAGSPSTISETPLSDNANAILMTAIQVEDQIIDVAYDPDVSQGFVLTASGILYLYTYPEFRGILERVPQESQAVSTEKISGTQLALDTTNHIVAYAGQHQDVVIYDYATHRTLVQQVMEKPVTCLMFNADGNTLIVGEWAREGMLHFIDTQVGETAVTIPTNQDLTRCTLSPDGTMLVTGNRDGEISLWAVS